MSNTNFSTAQGLTGRYIMHLLRFLIIPIMFFVAPFIENNVIPARPDNHQTDRNGTKNEGQTETGSKITGDPFLKHRVLWQREVILYEDHKVLASNGNEEDLFGCSASVSCDVAIFGARDADGGGVETGSAYIFRFNENDSAWTEEAALVASDAAFEDKFGYSVSISGDIAVVGVLYDDDLGGSSGSAWVYRYDYSDSNWAEESKLLASDGVGIDKFGRAVAVSGDVIIVGSASQSGAAYVFRYNTSEETWLEEAKLLPSDRDRQGLFGSAVSISNNVALIGAEGDHDLGLNAGAAYVFRFDCDDSSWTEETKLYASDGEQGDNYGISVSIYNNTAIVGAPNSDDFGSESGSAYIIRYDESDSSWTEAAKLLPSFGDEEDIFGFDVSISGDLAVIGAHHDDEQGYWSGSAYIFHYNGMTWEEEAKLLASDGHESLSFGRSVSVAGDKIVVGAFLSDDLGHNAGAGYIFHCNDGR